MSIIYDALKKVEGTIHKKPAVKIDIDKEYTPKRKNKIYLIYILAVSLGVFIANVSFKALGVLNKYPSKPVSIDVKIKTQAPVIKTQDNPGLPSPPSLSSPAQIRNKPLPSLVLNGIFLSENECYALINNRIVEEGDTIEGATVVEITTNEVELDEDGKIIKLSTAAQ